MGYRPGSRRSGKKFQKSQHEKVKAKTHKHGKNRLLLEERQDSTPEEIAEKTINSLKRLGEQKFAVSPFSHYFDDWLFNLKEVLSEFESRPITILDEFFLKEREHVMSRIQQDLADIRRDEAILNLKVNDLAEKNHLLAEIDAEYAAQTREIGPKRNAEIQGLTLNVRNLEDELERMKRMKTSFFGSFTKKTKAQKQAEIQQKLESAKTEVEFAVRNFKAEQEKFHDDYEKKKQTVTAQILMLEKVVEKLETDGSLDVRQEACEELINAVKALLTRKAPSID